ncbi:MAG: NADH-quinone oxidoreductase subunit L, partial [Bdellovibrionota bacterium]
MLDSKNSGFLATSLAVIAAFASYVLAWRFFSGADPTLKLGWSIDWLRFQPGMTVTLGVLIDPLSVMMISIVTTISALVHIYSLAYMKGDPGFGRYFAYLVFFTFSMLGLVTAPNLFQTYVFWELVGAISFLLIGFYYDKPAAVAASKKAFIVTRFADLGFLIGILVLGYHGYQFAPDAGNPFDFAFLNRSDVLSYLASQGVLTLALLLVYLGAAGKSAMFPLHIWLPDAMEGPTPVSALLHAATMVVAGVYLVARLFPAYAAAPDALQLVAVAGLVTSIFAAIVACTQDDIKRVLAFSTLSQLGYMMFSLGVATIDQPLGYSAALFHLYTHAFFKALLFLGAGCVIHAVHANDLWKMGGLASRMPVTHFAFAAAVLAISGVWPFSGFFSKDEILAAVLLGDRPVFFAGGLLVAGLTAYYMARVYVLAFHGSPRSAEAGHAHEAPLLMLVPICILTVLSIGSGWVHFADYV